MATSVPGARPPASTCVLLDTSASMNQRTIQNLSLLDAAKAAIEHMVRRVPNERQHKFLLVTTRDGGTVESGWADSQAAFLQKVKRPQFHSICSINARVNLPSTAGSTPLRPA